MTCVMLKTGMMAGWGASLLVERIPANYADPKSSVKAAALSKAFTETSWAKAQGKEFDLDIFLSELMRFARAKGYKLLDDPAGCYPSTPKVWERCWGPDE